jgi:hypothetical protein
MAYYRFIAKLSLSSFEFMKKVFNFSEAFMSGFWLGVMDEKSLDYSDELAYSRTKFYIDDKYNESGLFEWEKPIINKYFSNVKSILLVAAGGGREVLALTKMGYEVDSYECNPTLVESGNKLLQKNKMNNKIRYLPRNTVPDEIRKYDGIIIGWGAYSLIPGEKKRLSFLTKLYPFLNKETPLMISFLWTKKKSRKDKIIRFVSNFFRIFSNKEKTELGDRLAPDFIHYFNEEEIKSELIKSGYRVLEYYTQSDGCLIAGI